MYHILIWIYISLTIKLSINNIKNIYIVTKGCPYVWHITLNIIISAGLTHNKRNYESVSHTCCLNSQTQVYSFSVMWLTNDTKTKIHKEKLYQQNTK